MEEVNKQAAESEVVEVEEQEQEVKSESTEPVVSMENLSDEALDFDEPQRGQLREGTVMEIRENGLVVDIGAKRDGFVPASDLDELDESLSDFTSGQDVPVVVTRSRNHDGNVELSISQARLQEDWLEARRLEAEEEVYETSVIDSNRGGLVVEFGRLRGFVPMSQLIGFSRIRQAAERHRRLRSMVGDEIMLKVIEVNRRRRRLILSQRAAAKEWRSSRRDRLLEDLEPGQVRTGRLSQIADFGLFVNLGGLDGLVHVSELSWGRVENPEEIYRVGQRLKVQVINVDKERQRIGLSIKALTPDPWESVSERYSEGQLVEGKVTQVVDFGVFVELEPGIEGLLHNSELISLEQREELESGDKILVKIIRIESNRRRIGLSARQVRLHEWEQWNAERAEAEAAEAAAAEAAEAEEEELSAEEASEEVVESIPEEAEEEAEAETEEAAPETEEVEEEVAEAPEEAVEVAAEEPEVEEEISEAEETEAETEEAAEEIPAEEAPEAPVEVAPETEEVEEEVAEAPEEAVEAAPEEPEVEEEISEAEEAEVEVEAAEELPAEETPEEVVESDDVSEESEEEEEPKESETEA
ncbi:MAG: 30S ribosomal protein S1 [Anaerolineae bacterium]